MKLPTWTWLCGRFRRPAKRAARAVPPAASMEVLMPDAVEEQRAPGCGWYDSSHELQCGLQVQELAATPGLAAQVPLGWWLQWHLAGAVGGPGPAQGFGGRPG